jgi:peptide/nickel transport system permease protein
MLNFIGSRVLQMVPVILGVTIVTFILAQVIPGNPADALLGPTATQEARDQLYVELGLDRPLVVQYLIYLSNLLHGDLGRSFTFAQPVAVVLADRMFNTAILTVWAVIGATLIGIAAGTWAAMRPGSLHDGGLSAVVQFLNSMPPFWLGLVLIMIFGLHLRLLPVAGMYSIAGDQGGVDLALHMILPVVTMLAASLAIIARMTRSSLLEVINSDYIRTARSRGIGEARIVLLHALPNAMPPVITVIGLQMGYLLAGGVLTETVFAWPGIGLAMYQAISGRDLPLIQGGVLTLALGFVVINFAVDVLYAYFNPKIRLS